MGCARCTSASHWPAIREQGMSQAAISKTRWFWLLLVSLLLLHFFVFIQLPVSIYLESEALDSGTLPSIVMGLLVMGLASLLAFMLVLGLLGWPLRRVLGPLLLALALSYWIIDSFFGRSYPALDGALTELPLDAAHGWKQLLVFLVVFVFLLFSQRKFEVPVLAFLAALTLLNAFWVARSLWQLPEPVTREPAIAAEELFSLSKDRNVLIVLMDTFQSEYLEEVLAARPDLADGLRGFSYFPDTLGVATSTFMSVPAIHAGKPYEPSRTMSAYFQDSIKRESLLARLGEDGFRTILLNPIRHVCPEKAQCINRSQLLRSEWQSTFTASLHMLDISLMRSAPEPLKNAVFNGGAFLLAQHYSPSKLGGDALVVWDDSRVLHQFAERLEAGGSKPYVAFLHLMNTHPPYVLDSECAVAAHDEHERGSRDSAIQQATCGISRFVALLESLQAQGVYDETMIVLAGDHGSSSVYADASLASRRLQAETAYPEDAPRLVGSANPLLLIKPFAAQGPMRVSSQPADLTDIPATVCGALAECDWQAGVDLLSTPEIGARQRSFMNYRWEHTFWELGYIPELEFYTVTGPVSEWSSWRLESGIHRDTLVRLDFTLDDDPAVFGGGWGAVEMSPQGTGIRWVEGHVAELFLELEEEAGAGFALQLNFDFWVPDFNPDQALRMEFNGHEYAGQPLPPGLHNIKYRIMKDQLRVGQNRIALFFDALRRPNGEDSRALAVVARSLTVERIQLEH